MEYFEIVQTTARSMAPPHDPTYFQPPPPAAQSSTDMSSPMDLNAILQITTDTVNAILQRREGDRNSRDRSSLTCFYCGKQGHIKGKCRLKESDIEKLDQARLQKKKYFE